MSSYQEDPAPTSVLHSSTDHELIVRQDPERARVAGGKEKERKPIDPPPIIQLKVKDDNDPAQEWLQNPFFFMSCSLWDASEDKATPYSSSEALSGTLVSSLHRLKDIDNHEAGFFVFGDVSVRPEGEFRMRFDLFEIRSDEVTYLKTALSKPFIVLPAKTFPGMAESTFLSKSFADQGMKLRIRKEARTTMKRQFRPEEYTPMPAHSPDRPSMPTLPSQGQPVVSTYPPGTAYSQPGLYVPPVTTYPPQWPGAGAGTGAREYYDMPQVKRQRSSFDMGGRIYNDTNYQLTPNWPVNSYPFAGRMA